MDVIIDANIVISSLLSKSVTRQLLFDTRIICHAPQFIIDEVTKYKRMILERTNLTEETYKKLYEKIMMHIKIIPDDEIYPCMDRALEIIGNKDPEDSPYLAAILCTNMDKLWSQDKVFEGTNIDFYTTTDLYKIYLPPPK